MLASLLAAELLTFNSTGIAGHQTFLLERALGGCIVCNESARDAKADSTHLAGNSTAMGADFNVPFFSIAENGERKVSNHVLHIGMEIFLKIATIDGALAGTRLQDNCSDGVLATASATENLLCFCSSNRFILRPRNQALRFQGVGPCAAVPHQRKF